MMIRQIAAGLVASLAVQVLLNIGGVLNAVPMTGIPLPLLSLGGSSLMVTLVSLGILLGLSRVAGAEDIVGQRVTRNKRQGDMSANARRGQSGR